jgi:hypothetical protein
MTFLDIEMSSFQAGEYVCFGKDGVPSASIATPPPQSGGRLSATRQPRSRRAS